MTPNCVLDTLDLGHPHDNPKHSEGDRTGESRPKSLPLHDHVFHEVVKELWALKKDRDSNTFVE